MKTLAFFFALMVPALARLEETIEQCDARYGKPLGTPSATIRTYQKAGLSIGVSFRDGKAVAIVVCKTERDILDTPLDLSGTEIETLLNANGGSAKWKKSNLLGFMKQSWESDDGKFLAGYDPLEKRLMLMTKAELTRVTAESEAKEKKNLDGF